MKASEIGAKMSARRAAEYRLAAMAPGLEPHQIFILGVMAATEINAVMIITKALMDAEDVGGGVGKLV